MNKAKNKGKGYFNLWIIASLPAVFLITGCAQVSKPRQYDKAPLAAYEINYSSVTQTMSIKSIDVTPSSSGQNGAGKAGLFQIGNAIVNGNLVTATVYIVNNDSVPWTGVEMQAYRIISGSATAAYTDLGTGWYTDHPAYGAWGWLFTSGTYASEFTIPAGGQSVNKVMGFNATSDFVASVYIYADVPVISSITPSEALAGSTVTISGYNFSTTQGSVTFNNITSTVQSWSDNSIVVTIPANTTLGNVVVDSGIPNTPYSNPIIPIIALGTAAPFGGFGGAAGITNQGIYTVINGNIGTTGASTLVTGFTDSAGDIYTVTPSNEGTVNGTIDTAAPPPGGAGAGGDATTTAIATQALADANTAFNNLASLPGGTDPGSGQLGGLTLTPGIYKAAGGAFELTGSDLTLDGQGDPNAVWVFQMASSLTVGAAGAPRSIILINGAQAKNVFWQVGSAATINAAGGGTMVGTIIAYSGVTISTAGNVTVVTLNGRALGLDASVTMVNTVINVPAP